MPKLGSSLLSLFNALIGGPQKPPSDPNRALDAKVIGEGPFTDNIDPVDLAHGDTLIVKSIARDYPREGDPTLEY